MAKSKKKYAICDERLTEQDRYNCSVYALNSLLTGPRLAGHLVDLCKAISDDLFEFSEQKAEKIIKKRASGS